MAVYLWIYEPTHPLAQESDGRLTAQRHVLFAAIGWGPHSCHWCGSTVEWMPGARTRRGALVVDHLDEDGMNNDLTNLVPSCHRCNCRRGMNDLVGDDEIFIIKEGRRQRAEKRQCAICGSDFLFAYADKRPNRGRFCSRHCARSAPRK